MPSKAKYQSPEALAEMISVAQGQKPADLVIRGASWLDVFGGQFRRGDVAIHRGLIAGVTTEGEETYEGIEILNASGQYLVPGWIDSHVHIESSLMTPARFQEMVLPWGTTSAIWDPHEIANVWGVDGIAWALEASHGLRLDIFVMVPSCVPSTTPSLGLETSGASLGMEDLAVFRHHPRVLGLAEMMNFPGLLGGDPDVLAKLIGFGGALRDGHCPGLLGKALNAYGVAGIHSCHESTTLAEAREKLMKGVHVLIREGSCAKDAQALLPLVDAWTSASVGFCSDDRNPADVAREGHISCIIDQGLKRGMDPALLFRAASFAPARLYGLDDRGAVAPGYKADLVLVTPKSHAPGAATETAATKSPWTQGLSVETVFKAGEKVCPKDLKREAEERRTLSQGSQGARGQGTSAHVGRRNLQMESVGPEAFQVPSTVTQGSARVRVIGVIPGQILTQSLEEKIPVRDGCLCGDPDQDILKICVMERHHGTGRRSTAFVRGFGLTKAAIATSINHDSHNVIVVGPSDALMARAVGALLEIDGGIVVAHEDGRIVTLPLPIGGLMTDASPEEVTKTLMMLKELAHQGGCPLHEPFLQLSFLALPVIPTLKITDQGLVDVLQSKLLGVEV